MDKIKSFEEFINENNDQQIDEAKDYDAKFEKQLKAYCDQAMAAGDSALDIVNAIQDKIERLYPKDKSLK